MEVKSSNKHGKLNVGLGIIYGSSLGAIFGLLFLNGNIGPGIAFGAAAGIVLGAISEAQRAK